MPEPARIGLDNSVFAGRLRSFNSQPRPPRNVNLPRRHIISDYRTASRSRHPLTVRQHREALPATRLPGTARLERHVAAPIQTNQQLSSVSNRQIPYESGNYNTEPAVHQRRYTGLQMALVGMACLVFIIGLLVSWQAFKASNHSAKPA